MTGDMAVSLAIDKLRAALQDLAYQKMLIRSLLDQVGVPAHCKWCGAPIRGCGPPSGRRPIRTTRMAPVTSHPVPRLAELRRRQIQPVTTNSKGDGNRCR